MRALHWVALGVLAAPLGAQEPYRDAKRPIEQRVTDLIGRMTLEEKFWQLYMIPGALSDGDYSKGVFGLQNRSAPDPRSDAELHNTMQRYFASTRLGIPQLPFEEAVHGLMRRGATVFPQAIALAATWDTALVGDVVDAIASETLSRGIRQVLSPVINIANDVRWGRVEETYGEDPYLSAVMGRVYVRGIEQRGIVATPKHFVANVGEGGRDSYPIEMSARLLEEIHFPPFRAALRAGARSIMTSYNSVDGSPATQNNALLNETLKRDWRFFGFVISDQAATGGATVLHHTEPNTPTATAHALASGLDVIFQSSYPQHRTYLDAFTRGLIPDSVINAAVARVLRVKFQLGLFDYPYVDADSATYWNRHERHRTLARESARASLVLLRNERNRLPLRGVRTVAVIGPDASEARLGGYTIDSAKGTSIVEGLRARLGAAAVRYEAGPGRGESRLTPNVILSGAKDLLLVPGTAFDTLKGEYWDNNRLEGAPRVTRSDPNIDFRWTLNSPARGIPFDWYSARWTGRLKVPAGGVRRIAVEGNDGYRLYVDDKLVIDNWRKVSFGTRVASVALAPASVHAIRLEYFESTGNARLRLLWDAGVRDDSEQRIAAAVAAARASDVAIVVAGVEEGEFRDRGLLSLPGRQEELIERVAATGKPVVVVLIGGSAITMSRWLDKVDAVMQAWYPGEEGGHAIADVLFGDYNPAGRLPITFPVAEGQLPLTYNHKPTGRGDDYVDLTGQPLFPFGYGLSYSTFEYSALVVEPATITESGSAKIRFRVKNTGTRAGDEVPQLYVRDVLASVARPMMELKGFTRIRLQPGEERVVELQLRAQELRFLDERMRWVVEPGVWRIMVGASSKDIRLRGELSVQP